jgi:predicted flap endonuclease-1-like 5' DNA nuclease
MPYTLAKALLWLVLAGLLGVIVGWLLRSVAAKRQLVRARSQHADGDETQRLKARVAELEAAAVDRDRLAADRDRFDVAAGARVADTDPDTTDASPRSDPAADELDAAAEVLGRPVVRDDLKLIEGIGPSIEDLCHGIGIRTWSDMAATEPSLLRTMLNDAGPRSKTQDPDGWPRQAALLAAGDWEAFRDLVAELRNGVTSP